MPEVGGYPAYLLLEILAAPLVLLIGVAVWRDSLPMLRLFAVSSILIWMIHVAGALWLDSHLKRELETFDLDGDGFFSGAEVSPAQQEALLRVTSDTGRTFSPITGAVLGVGLTGIAFGGFQAIRHARGSANRAV